MGFPSQLLLRNPLLIFLIAIKLFPRQPIYFIAFMSITMKRQKHVPLSLGDTVYIHYIPRAPQTELLFYADRTDDEDLIFAGKFKAAGCYSAFKSSHFIVLPCLLCNSEGQNFVSSLLDQLNLLNASAVHNTLPNFREQTNQMADPFDEQKKLIDTSPERASFYAQESDTNTLMRSKKTVTFSEYTQNNLGEEYSILYGFLKEEFAKKQSVEDSKEERLRLLNARILEENLGKPVRYEDRILLYHPESQQFLTASEQLNPLDSSILKLSLKGVISDRSYFQFKNLPKFGNFGDTVEYETPLQLITLEGNVIDVGGRELKDIYKSSPNLYQDNLVDLNQTTENSLPSEAYFPCDMHRNDYNTKLFDDSYPVGVSGLKKVFFHFKLSLYCTYRDQLEVQKSKVIKNGDYVRIQTNNHVLTASKTNNEERCYYEQYNYTEHSFSLIHSVFQVIHLDPKWHNDSALPLGQPITYFSSENALEHQLENKGIMLKHLFTGLAFDNPGKNKPFRKLDSQKGETTSTIHLYGRSSSQEEMLSKSGATFMRLSSEKQQLVFFDDGKQIKSDDFKTPKETPYFDGFEVPEDNLQQYLRITRKKPVNKQKLPSAMKFMKVPAEEIHVMNENMSFARELKIFYLNLVDCVKNNELVQAQKLSKMIKKCEGYYHYLFLSTSEDPFATKFLQFQKPSLELDEVNKLKQIYARECGIIDLCNKSLFYLVVNPDNQANTHHPFLNNTAEIMRELVQILVKITLAVLRHNPVNNRYNSQYVRMYIHSIIKPQGLYKKVAKSIDEENELKDIILSVVLEFFSGNELHALNQINYFLKETLQFLENQQDFSVHLIKLLQFAFRGNHPDFYPYIRTKLMQNLLANKEQFENLFPKIYSANDGSLYCVFKRSQRNPSQIAVAELKEGLPETTYLVWILKLIVAMADKDSVRFKQRLMTYYLISDCKRIVASREIFYEIRNLIGMLVDKVHRKYQAIRCENIPSQIKILGLYKKTAEAKASEILLKAKGNLIGQIEADLIASQDSNAFRVEREDIASGLRFLRSLDFQWCSFQEFTVALSIIASRLGEGKHVERKELALMNNTIWSTLDTLLHREHNNETTKLIARAISLLTVVENRILAHYVNHTLEEIQRDAAAFEIMKDKSKKDFSKFETGLKTSITNLLNSEWKNKKKLFEFLGSEDGSASCRQYNSEATFALLAEVLETEKEHTTLQTVLRYLAETTRYNATILNIFENFVFFDEPGLIDELIRILELVNEIDRIKRELQMYKEFDVTMAEFDYIHKIMGTLVLALEEIISIVYNCKEHVHNTTTDWSNSHSKALFFNSLRKLKTDPNPPAFEVKREAISKHWQKVLRAFEIHTLLIPLCQKLLNPKEAYMEYYYTDSNVLLAVRLIFVLMIIFVYEFPENQKLLANYEPFMSFFLKPNPRRDRIIGVDKNIVFIEMLRGNLNLLKLNHDHILQILRRTFIENLQKPLVLDSQIDNTWRLSYEKSLKVIVLADIQQEYFDPYKVIMTKTKELFDLISKKDLFSFKAMVKAANIQSQSLVLVSPPSTYELVLETLQGISSLLSIGDPLKIALFQEEILPQAWLALFANKDLVFQFNYRSLLLRNFKDLFFNKFKKPGILNKQKDLFRFLGVLLMEIAAFAKHRASCRSEIWLESPKATPDFLKTLQNTPWFAPIVRDDPSINALCEEYREIIESLPLRKIYISNFMKAKSLQDDWCTYLADCIQFLRILLSEKRNILSDNILKPLDYIIALLMEIVNIDELSSLIQTEIYELAMSVSALKEYDFWKQALVKVAYQNTNLARSVHHKLTTIFLNNSGVEREEFSPYGINFIGRTLATKIEEIKKKSDLNQELKEIKHLGERFHKNRAITKCIVQFIKRSVNENSHVSKECHFAVKLMTEIIKAHCYDELYKAQPIFLWKQLSKTDCVSLESIQTYLSNLGVIQQIMQIFETTNDKALITDLLELMNCLCFGGNLIVQEALFSLVEEDPENAFIKILHQHLTASFNVAKAYEKQRVQKLYTEFETKLYHLDPQLQSKMLTQLQQKDSSMLQKISATLSPEETREIAEYAPTLLMILKLIQNLCESHYTKFQEFFRAQKIDGKKHPQSINLVKTCKYMLHDYVAIMSKYNVDLGLGILDVLTEFVQSKSKGNSQYLLQNTTLEDLTNLLGTYDLKFDLIARGFEGDITHPALLSIQQRVIIFLRDLVEGADPKQLSYVQEQINFKFLIRMLLRLLNTFFGSKGFVFSTKSNANRKKLRAVLSRLNFRENSGIMRSALRIYSFLKYFWRENLKNFEQRFFREAYECGFTESEMKELGFYVHNFLEEYLLSVEIVTQRTPDLIRVYFPKLTMYEGFEKTFMLENFLNKVDRSNIHTKIEGLMNESRKINTNLQFQDTTKSSINYLLIFQIILGISHALGAAINIYLVLQLRRDDTTPGVTEATNQDYVMATLLSMQILMALLQLVGFLHTRHRVIILDQWNQKNNRKILEHGRETINELERSFRAGNIDSDKITRSLCDLVLDLKGPISEEYEMLSKSSRYIRLKRVLIEVGFLVRRFMFFWQVLFLLICIGSLFHWFLCTLQTINWTVRSDTVRRVGKAISLNQKQFRWTFLLLLITVYIYSMIGYYFLNEYFHVDDKPICGDAFQCFFETLSEGLRAGGGIADSILTPDYNENSRIIYLLIVIYDISFFFLVIVLLLNVVFGMIIDSFGNLRDENKIYQEDKKNVCFICGINRDEYERVASFDVHVEQEHNPKNYLYYLIYVCQKEKVSAIHLTDIESYVFSLYSAKENKWIPIGRALPLEQSQATA